MGVAYNPNIVTDGLVLCLDAANKRSYPGTGTTWTDRSANGNNGTLTNGPTFDSANGGSIVFDGTNDYVTTTKNNLDINNLSICCWVFFTSIPATYTTITNKETSNLNRNWWIGLDPNGYFTFLRSRNGADTGISSSVTAVSNNWYFFCCTNNSTPIYSIYLDGVLINQNNYGSGTLSVAGSNNYIGSYASGGGSLYNLPGQIANILYYNRTLSADEVRRNYLATKGRFQ